LFAKLSIFRCHQENRGRQKITESAAGGSQDLTCFSPSGNLPAIPAAYPDSMNQTSFCNTWPQPHASWERVKRSKLKLSIETLRDVTVIRCEGRIAYREEAAQLSKEVADSLRLSRHLVLDLSGVELIDSAGLGELVMLLLWAQASGVSIRLAAPRPIVRQSLDLTNLTSVFEIYPTLADAIRASRAAVI
jgi:anti-anti-sigma factor